ncbi:hypothetical protein CTEN210_02376 [Chaetoceros tenuissimus]|uniref:DIS3-like exonuclease 1 n=2 Tax=Chaetoceros tenuissimus TaxID=426638 RepID=A0AAD3H0C0_9STRA|nr:hypothetical protein CTEN210_02376 [Chaetoceros tenuissimus]
MKSERWISKTFHQDKLRYRERYQRNETLKKSTLIPELDFDSKGKSPLIIIPDGQFLRKYLKFLEEWGSQHSMLKGKFDKFIFILLESAAEIMDYRNSSPCLNIPGSDGNRKESTAINERKRISALLQDFHPDKGHADVVYRGFADLSGKFTFDDGDRDEFDIFDYRNMAIADRSRCSILRAATLLVEKYMEDAYNMIILSEDETLLSSSIANDKLKIMNCQQLLDFLTEKNAEEYLIRDHWENVIDSCKKEYELRNFTPVLDQGDSYMDNYLHFEHLSPEELESGLSQKKLFRSTLKVSNENYKEGYASVQIDGSSTKYFLNEISGHFNRCIHDDTVVIEPLPRDQWEEPVGRKRLVHISNLDENNEIALKAKRESCQNPVPTARVVGLHKTTRQRRKFVATMVPPKGRVKQEDSHILVVPMDSKIPIIRIKTRIHHEVILNQRLLVEIDNWELGSMYPLGHIVKLLGEVGDLNTEIACLLREYGVDLSPFSANALACLPIVGDEGWKIDPSEIEKRRDLRDLRIFSVDPVGCQDIDDTMHARRLKSGDIEVGVHIADVTHFVKQNSALDKEAARRATTFYLVDRRFDMLPSIISGNLASLHDQVDRLAVSVIWTLSPDFETVKDVWYGRTVIHNVQAMTYEQAHNILHDIDPEGHGYQHPPPLTAGCPVNKTFIKDLKHDLLLLTKLARKLRKDREINGAVDLSSGDRGSELKFVLNERGEPTKVVPKKELEIHHTIAELMIYANRYVAEKIYSQFPDVALLRVHGFAKADNFEELELLMKSSGVDFDGKSNKSLAASLGKARELGSGSINNSLFQSLATRAMSEAQYICTGDFHEEAGLTHYGLGIDYYTHFTSPIRRYADVIVHRLLLESLQDTNSQRIQNISQKVSVPIAAVPDSNAVSVLSGEGLNVDEGETEYSFEDDAFLDSLIEGAEELVLGSVGETRESTDKQLKEELFTSLVPSYETTELSKTCEILNSQNRTAKLSSMECQRLFLSLYFRDNKDITDAVVTDVKQNGMIVYVPKYDMKGPVFLADKGGNVQIDPSLVGLPLTSGLPPSSGFASLEHCRMFPEGTCTLIDEDKVEVTIPSSPSKLSFQRLDVIKVHLSCALDSVVARVPPPKLHLTSAGNKYIPRQDQHRPTEKGVVKISASIRKTDSPLVKSTVEPLSIYSILASISINSMLQDTDIRSHHKQTFKSKRRVQKLKGRIYMNGYKDEILNPKDETFDHNDYHTTSITNQAIVGDYNASRQIEREATARMQRIAAERRNAKRSKAMKRK